jgi:hypothetical protein
MGKLAPSNDWNDCKIKRTPFAHRFARKKLSAPYFSPPRSYPTSGARRRFSWFFFAFNAARDGGAGWGVSESAVSTPWQAHVCAAGRLLLGWVMQGLSRPPISCGWPPMTPMISVFVSGVTGAAP